MRSAASVEGASRDQLAALQSERLARFTSRLPTEPGALQRELQGVRQTGVACSRGDDLEGLVAAAAPVLDPTGALLGVLYAFGLGDVIGDPGLLRAGQRVRQAAQTATRRWGGAPGPRPAAPLGRPQPAAARGAPSVPGSPSGESGESGQTLDLPCPPPRREPTSLGREPGLPRSPGAAG